MQTESQIKPEEQSELVYIVCTGLSVQKLKIIIIILIHKKYMSHVLRKPHFAICEQQRRSLISAFVFRCLDSIIPLVSISEISSLYLAFVAAQASLCLTLSKTPKTGFLVTRLMSSFTSWSILQ